MHKSKCFDLIISADNAEYLKEGMEMKVLVSQGTAELDSENNLIFKKDGVVIEDKEIQQQLWNSFKSICRSQIVRGRFNNSEEYNAYLENNYTRIWRIDMPKPEYKLMISELVIASSELGGNPVYGDTATKIALQDDCGGCFLEIKQAGNDWNGNTEHCIRLDEDEIPALIKALQVMQKELESAAELDKLREAK